MSKTLPNKPIVKIEPGFRPESDETVVQWKHSLSDFLAVFSQGRQSHLEELIAKQEGSREGQYCREEEAMIARAAQLEKILPASDITLSPSGMQRLAEFLRQLAVWETEYNSETHPLEAETVFLQQVTILLQSARDTFSHDHQSQHLPRQQHLYNLNFRTRIRQEQEEVPVKRNDTAILLSDQALRIFQNEIDKRNQRSIVPLWQDHTKRAVKKVAGMAGQP